MGRLLLAAAAALSLAACDAQFGDMGPDHITCRTATGQVFFEDDTVGTGWAHTDGTFTYRSAHDGHIHAVGNAQCMSVQVRR